MATAIACVLFALSVPLRAAPAPISADTQTHAVTIQDGSTALDFKALTMTLGNVTISDAAGIRTISLGSTNGTKIGATSDKIGFLGATPIVRPASTTDIRTALINLGLYTTGGASPLNLNGGTLTSGPLSATTGAFSSTLTVTGAATFSSTVNLGALSASSSTISGNSTVGGTFGVTGASALHATTVTGTLGVSSTFTGAAGSFSGAFSLKDASDNTKIATFGLSNIGTGTTRTVNIPNANSTTVQPYTHLAPGVGEPALFITGMSAQGVFSTSYIVFTDVTSTPTTLDGYGITDGQLQDDDLDAIAALSTTSYGRSILTRADSTAARNYLGLAIGFDVQAYDVNLDRWAAKTIYAGSLAITSGKSAAFNNSITIEGSDGKTLNIGEGGTLGANAYSSTAFVPQTTRVNGYPLSGNVVIAASDLGVVPGVDVQPFSLNLNGWALKTPFAGSLAITSGKTFTVSNSITLEASADDKTLNIGAGGTLGSNAYSSVAFVPTTTSVNGHALTGNVSVTPADLNLVIGTNTQAWDADLDTLAGKTIPAGATLADTTSAQTFSGPKTIVTPYISTVNSVVGQPLALNGTISGPGSASIAGSGITITASNAVAGSSIAGAAQGGSVTITAGDSKRLTSGNANGGQINLAPGAAIGSGIPGKVVISEGTLTPPDNSSGFTLANETWPLHIVTRDGGAGGIGLDSFGTGNFSAFGVFDFRRANGTAASPTALRAYDLMGVFGALGYTGSGWSGGQAQIRYYTSEDWTPFANGTYLSMRVTPLGSTAANEMVKISGDRAVIGGSTVDGQGNITSTDGTVVYRSGGMYVGDTLTTDPGTGILQVSKGFRPPHIADGAAANDSIYYSTTQSKLVYKDSGAGVHVLY